MDIHKLDHIKDLAEYVSTLSLEGKTVVLNYLQAVEQYKTENKIKFFEPDEWQLKAIKLGSTEQHRMVCASNRIGKSYFSTFETICHATGKYPDDWEGFKFDKPINVLVLGVDWSQLNKPKCTAELILGPADKRGTGWIPKQDITRMVSKMGIPNGISTVYVKHYDSAGVCDGDSRITFDVYSAGDSTLMGMEVDFALMDEQVPVLIHSQVKTRTWSSRGRTLYVGTPERGLDEVIRSFWEEDGIHHSGLIHATLWESNQFTEEEKINMNNQVEPWARQFRIEGIPSAGSGAVFAGILKETLLDNTFEISPYWKRMSAADLGFRDSMAFSFVAKDESTGMYYLYDELTYTETDAIICASGVRPMQQGYIPMILPADGDSERGLGATYRSIFEGAGIITCKEQAKNWYYDRQTPDRTIKPGIIFMRELMLSGKLKVHPKCIGFLREFSLYSYDENGKFIDKDNHNIDSVRYCLMAIDKFGKSEYEYTHNTSKVISTERWNDHYDSQDNY